MNPLTLPEIYDGAAITLDADREELTVSWRNAVRISIDAADGRVEPD